MYRVSRNSKDELMKRPGWRALVKEFLGHENKADAATIT